MNTQTSVPHFRDPLSDAQEPVPFPRTPPRTIAPQPERPICTRTKRCEGCPYPAHGFICWSESGPCLRTLTERRRKATQENTVPDKTTPTKTGLPNVAQAQENAGVTNPTPAMAPIGTNLTQNDTALANIASAQSNTVSVKNEKESLTCEK